MDARDLEVRCEWCDAGFAAGTRTCVHCGHALGRPRRARQDDDSPFAGGHDEQDEEGRTLGSFWSNVVPGIAALGFVLLSYLLKACQAG